MALTNKRADLVPASEVKKQGSDQGLEIERGPKFQQREWRVQRVGWTVGTLLLAVACLGVFGGSGPLAYTDATTAEGLKVEWPRFTRHQGHATLQYEIPAGAISDGQVEIFLTREFVHGLEIQSIAPEPSSQRLDVDGFVYVFEATPGADLRVEFDVRPESQWKRTGRTGIVGGDAVTITQFVYP